MKTPNPIEQKVADFLMERGCALKMAAALECARLVIRMIQKGTK